MPAKGFKSITIRDEDYDFFKQLWDENKAKLRKQGITSFGGFVTKMLYEALERDEKQAQEQ